MAPPTVRMIALMALATPVTSCGTASTIRFAVARMRARTEPEQHRAQVDVDARIVDGGEQEVARGARTPSPRPSGSFEPSACRASPLSGPATSITSDDGSRNSPLAVTEAPKP